MDSNRNDGQSRWPILAKNSQAIHRLTPADEKARRSQVNIDVRHRVFSLAKNQFLARVYYTECSRWVTD